MTGGASTKRAAERTPTYRTDFLDFPTAWRVQESGGLEHASRECSAVQSPAFLCDCGAVAVRWAELVETQGDPRPDILRYLPKGVR